VTGRRALVLAAALAAAVLVLLAAVAAGGATRAVIPGCGGGDHARYKPTTVYVLCGDGSFRAVRMSWSSWTATSASGRGTAKVNDCKPNCAEGSIESFRVKLVASRPRTCANGKREFRRLTYSFPRTKPDGARRSGTLRRPCSS
jgi:hypothetical protein